MRLKIQIKLATALLCFFVSFLCLIESVGAVVQTSNNYQAHDPIISSQGGTIGAPFVGNNGSSTTYLSSPIAPFAGSSSIASIFSVPFIVSNSSGGGGGSSLPTIANSMTFVGTGGGDFVNRLDRFGASLVMYENEGLKGVDGVGVFNGFASKKIDGIKNKEFEIKNESVLVYEKDGKDKDVSVEVAFGGSSDVLSGGVGFVPKVEGNYSFKYYELFFSYWYFIVVFFGCILFFLSIKRYLFYKKNIYPSCKWPK